MQTKSAYFVIPDGILEDVWDDESLENCVILTKYVKENLSDKIKDGDVLGPSDEEKYRNSGCYFWDAKEGKVVCFESDLDDYGCLPLSFDITRFGVHHFDSVMQHNSYVRLPANCINHITYTATYGMPPSDLKYKTEPQENIVWAYFFIENQKYYVIGVPIDCTYKQYEIKGSGKHGDVIVHQISPDGQSTEYLRDSDVYVANFMRLFLNNVYSGHISSVCAENGYESLENVLYVCC